MPANKSILLNAEPFGFGPAAAIATFAPLLADYKLEVSYIGESHTLDLQRSLPYENMYDISSLNAFERKKLLIDLSNRHDYFFTAMDFDMALLAKVAGMKTVVYDALTWYWPEIHPGIKNADLYIAQNYFGVEDRIKNELGKLPKTRVVKPIVESKKSSKQKDLVFLNLGGLQNPFWELSTTANYAKTILEIVEQILPANERLVVATSSKVTSKLNNPIVKNYSRNDVIKLLTQTKYAIMTPGLGNIYDVASFNIPTLWLPPANDSQGQQTQLLVENDCCDEYLDWKDFTQKIDYSASQVSAMEAISSALESIEQNTMIRKVIINEFEKRIDCSGVSPINTSPPPAMMQSVYSVSIK